MLDLNPETICFIIAKAHEFHAKEGVVLPEDASTDWGAQMLADHADDLTFAEVKSTIDDLEPDQQAQLVALMWVGRGDFDAAEWEAAVEEARANLTAHTAEYLMGTPLVADYLEEGLTQMGYSCEE
jgi:hypothetical protein